jgi:hypothetical protein
VGREAIKPTDNDTPISDFSLGKPAKAIAIEKLRHLGISWKVRGKVDSRWGKVKLVQWLHFFMGSPPNSIQVIGKKSALDGGR